MTTVFVSHATADRPFIERELIPFLNSHGIRAWYCKETISTGAQWEKTIRTGLQGSDWFLVVVSPQAITSEWVRSEVDWALENLSTRVVPLLIGGADAGEIHLRLRLVQSVDWTSSSADAKIQLLYAWSIPSSKNQICESRAQPETLSSMVIFLAGRKIGTAFFAVGNAKKALMTTFASSASKSGRLRADRLP